MRNLALKIFLIFATLFLIACSSEKSEFVRAQSEGLLEFSPPYLFVEFNEDKLSGEQKEQITSELGQNGGIKANINGTPSLINARFDGTRLYLYLPLKAKTDYKISFQTAQMPINLEFKTGPLKLEMHKNSFVTSANKSTLELVLSTNFALDEVEKLAKKGAIKLLKEGKEFEFKPSFNANEFLLSLKSAPFELVDKVQNLTFLLSENLGLEKETKFEFASPIKGELGFMGTQIKEDGVELEFSQALDGTQDLKELINISPNLEFKALVLGSKIKLIGAFLRTQDYEIKVAKALKSAQGARLDKDISIKAMLKDLEPSLAFSSTGVFLPSSAHRKIAFKSLNVRQIKLEIYRIQSKNFSEYLRYSDFEHRKNLSSQQNRIMSDRGYTTTLVLSKKFELESKKNEWMQHELELDALKSLSGAFILRLSFDERGADYDFSALSDYKKARFFEQKGEVSKNLIFSNLALSAENLEDQYFINVRDFTTNGVQSGVKLELISNKNRLLDEAISDSEGRAVLRSNSSLKNKNSAMMSSDESEDENEGTQGYKSFDYFAWQNESERALFILASKEGQMSVLRLGSPLSTDGFDVSGAQENSPIKAFIYTERGVYRPGNKIHLSIVAKNEKERIKHPINLSFIDPKGKVILKESLSAQNEMFYKELSTNLKDTTGIYKVKIDIAGALFWHEILLQSVAPNRILVELSAPKEASLSGDEIELKLAGKYLFGAPASNLKYELSTDFSELEFKNSKFKDYIFKNSSLYENTEQTRMQAKLDKKGLSSPSLKLPQSVKNAQNSNFNAFVLARVIETSGQSVVQSTNIKLVKFNHFVGLKRLKNAFVAQGAPLEFEVIVSDLKENLVADQDLEYQIYRAKSSWWWDFDDFNSFVRSSKNSSKLDLIAQGELKSGSKPVKISLETKDLQGDFFIEVKDKQNGTSSAQSFYISSFGEPSAADVQTALKIKSDKASYKPTDKAIIEFESTQNAKALITLSGSLGIIKQFVLDTKATSTSFEVPIEKDFAPNIYASVRLLQDYAHYDNDHALRLFGVLPISVVDEGSKLGLNLKAPDKVLPGSEFEVSVQSSDKRPYTYTLAVVDEGLLSLSDFKTPDIWGYFYAKMGFRLKVFDTYDKIIAKSFGAVQKVLATGGDKEASVGKNRDEQAQRFKPVVLFSAPLKSDAKGFAKLKFKMPNYVGKVRVMAVAHNESALGSADKSIEVSAPAVALLSLPRALKMGDEFEILVQIFRVDKDAKRAFLSLKSKKNLVRLEKSDFNIDLSKNAVQNVYIKAKALENIGVEDFELVLKAQNHDFSSNTQIDIKPLNAYTYESEQVLVKAGQSKEFSLDESFVLNSAKATLKISPRPILELDKRLFDVLHYPYYSLEQTSSAALAQLYLDKFSTKMDREQMRLNINAALERLKDFSVANGGFAYWQGGVKADEWASFQAGYLMILAKNAGFYVDESLYQRWLAYEKELVKSGAKPTIKAQALFLLALAKEPNISAMNALFEELNTLDNTSKWQLAAAYKLAGIEDIATQIASNLSTEPNFKSNSKPNSKKSTDDEDLSDKAMIANAYKIIYNKPHKALVDEISAILQSSSYLSTQSTAYALVALALNLDLENKDDLSLDASLNLNGDTQRLSGKEPVSFEFSKGVAKVSAHKDTFINFGAQGFKKELAKPFSKNLQIKRQFFNEKGESIDASVLESGTSFYMRLEVRSVADFKHLALTQALPSGWQVAGTLKQSVPKWLEKQTQKPDFIDIRDDKIMVFKDVILKDEPFVFYIKLNAVTPGKFTLSSAFAEAMYSDVFQALSAGMRVSVKNRAFE